ncbi:MAG: hypothetical protein JW902_04010 [Syntrophaceae bacterium]|nr:hypothetical protein [Syntrophaceae bacterium]
MGRRNVFFAEQFFLCVAGALGLFGFLSVVSSSKAFGMLWGLTLPLVTASTAFLIQDFFRRYFFASLKPSFALINDLVSYGLQVAALIILHFFVPLSVPTVFWVMALTSTAAIAVGGFQLKGESSWFRFNKRDAIVLVKNDWDYGKWLLATNIAYWGGSQLVIYWAAAYISLAEVGAMGAARNVVGVVNIMFLGLQNFMPSRAANVFSHTGYSGLNKYLRRVAFWGFLGTLLFMLMFGVPGEFWLKVLYGPSYQGYGWVVLLWGVYFLIGFLHRPCSTGLRVLNKTLSIFKANACGAAIAMLAGYPLLRYFGLEGAMITVCVIQSVILFVLFVSYHGLRTKQSVADEVCQ